MRVISLYSFKGGVGRTSLALNLAYELALQAKFVVLADWDLHAPGLSLMNDLAMPNGPFPRKGILDFLWSALSPLESLDQATTDVIDPLLLTQPTVLAERSRINRRSFGDILFIPAGLFGSDNQNSYPKSLRKLHLPDLVTWRARLPGNDSAQSVLRFFGDRVGAARSEAFGKDYPPDFLLLDSRTGITEIGDVLLGNGVDHYIVLFGLNEQNQAGMEMIVRGAQERVHAGGLPDVLTLIASPVPVGEEDLLRERLTALSTRLGRLARPIDDAGKPEPLPLVLRIPYHPRLALREEIIIERYPDSALAQNYRDIAAHILRQERTLESTEINTRAQVLADVPPTSLIMDSMHDMEIQGPQITLQRIATAPRLYVEPPRPYVEPPPWYWAGHNLRCELLIPDVDPELSQMLLDGIAWSNSLHVDEKIRVMEFAATLPAPRVARLAEPLIKERENRAEAWKHDWRAVEGAHAKAATDWITVLERLRRIDSERFWASVGADATKSGLSTTFASPRVYYLIARELVSRRRFRSAIPVLICALSSSALALVSVRAAEVVLRLRSLDLEALERNELKQIFPRIFPRNAMEAFQSIFDLHLLEGTTIVGAMTAIRQVGWESEANVLGKQLWFTKMQGAENWAMAAYQYKSLGDLASAERAAKRAIEQNPRSVDAWIVLATSLMQGKSHPTEAWEALQRAEQLATRPRELRVVATTLAEDFSEYNKALQLYEKVVTSEQPHFTHEAELAEIAIAAQAPEVARHALARARILLEGPLTPGLGPRSGNRDYIAAFHVLELSLALLQNDPDRVKAASTSLIEAVKARVSRDWRFDALMSGLRHLQDNDLRLLKSATRLAHDGDVVAFQATLEAWDRARGSSVDPI